MWSRTGRAADGVADDGVGGRRGGCGVSGPSPEPGRAAGAEPARAVGGVTPVATDPARPSRLRRTCDRSGAGAAPGEPARAADGKGGGTLAVLGRRAGVGAGGSAIGSSSVSGMRSPGTRDMVAVSSIGWDDGARAAAVAGRSVRRRAAAPAGRSSAGWGRRRSAVGAGTSPVRRARASAARVSAAPAWASGAGTEVGRRRGAAAWLFWRRGGTGGRRRAQVAQWVASTGFSALQNGQNLMSPASTRGPDTPPPPRRRRASS